MRDDEARPKRLTRAETKARTRALLLDAAAQVFARKGFAGASVEDIAETAGFSTGALYSNFSGKDELFIELLSHRSSSRLADAATLVSENSGIEEAQDALSRYLIEIADEDRDLAALQAEFWLYAIRRPEYQKSLAGQFRANRDGLASVLAARAEKRGQAAGAPFDEVATVLLAMFQGLVQLRRTDPELVPENLYGQAAHWLFAGLRATRDE
ncbi:TetR family transcriptional regulator [Streptomyces sp. DW26H14]|uniref:TetR family transcriptional regulator n=1 Tax=Streptomyces sp. DW26H14 TaxID=3435395 RepID=UPI00403D5FA6